MIDLEITVTGAKELAGRFDGVDKAVNDATVRIARRVGARVALYVQQSKLSGSVGIGRALAARTGTLRRSIFWRVAVSASEVVVRIGSDLAKAVYGRIHEKGGTITPRRGRFLTIPVGRAKTAGGVARFTAREFIDNPEAFGFVGSFVNRSKTAIMGVRVGRRGKGGVYWKTKAEPVFALKTSVTIPESAYLRNSLQELRPQIEKEFHDGVTVAVREHLKS